MRNAPEKYNTLGYFNLARGLGILMIVMGHSVSPAFFGNTGLTQPSLFAGAGYILGGGVLAMFFMISGFGFYVRSPKKCLSIQKKMLLKPYAFVALSIIAAKSAISLIKGRPLLATLLQSILPFLLGMNAENIGALSGEPVKSVTVMWFVMALFVGWITYNRICRLKNRTLKTALVACCVTLGWVLTAHIKAWPFCLPMGLMTVGYLSAGYQIKQSNMLTRKLPGYAIPVMMIVIALSCCFGNVDIGAGVWKTGPLDVAATFCIGFLLLRGYAILMELDLKHTFVSVLEWIGSHSIWMLSLHAIEKSLFPWYRLNQLLWNHPFVYTILCFLSRAALIWLMHYLYSRIKRLLPSKKKIKITIEP